MMTLNQTQIDEIRSELQRMKTKLERSMKISAEAVRPVDLDQTAVGRLSRMDAIQNQAMSQGLRDREQMKYAEVLSALERLERGTYGQCGRCGEAIAVARLQVFPEVKACVSCAD